MQAETGATWPRTKEHRPQQKLEESHPMEPGQGPGSLQRGGPVDTLISDLRPPELRENPGLLL